MANDPYVYRLEHPVTGEFYIGFQCGKKKLGVDYFTSSKFVKPRFHEFDVTMQLFCNDAQEAYDLEQFLIWVDWKKPGMINKVHHYGKSRFNVVGIKRESISDETRDKLIKSSARKGRPAWNKGKTCSIETKAKMAKAKLNKKRPEEAKLKMSESAKARWARERLAKA